MLKKYFILAAILTTAFNIALSQQYWIERPSPSTKYLSRIIFTDTLNGCASGDSGIVIHTSDGGLNWNTQNSGTNLLIDDIYFLNNQTGWILSNDYFLSRTYFSKTINGGNNWFHADVPDTNEFLLSVYFRDSQTGFLGGRYGTIYRTLDGGATWNKCGVDSVTFTSYPLKRFKFYDSSLGYACGGIREIAGSIWTTSNGGSNWKITVISPEPEWDFKIINSEKVIFIGGDLEYGASTVTTVDHGMHFQYDTIGCRGMTTAIAFRRSSEVWAPLSYSQAWAVNLDSGEAAGWFIVPTRDSTVVLDVVFLSPTFGWACGFVLTNGSSFDGTLLKYNTDIIGIKDKSRSVPDDFEVYQNYPNPFNPVTNFKYFLPKASEVEISYFDAAGKLLKTVHENSVSAGYHVITFDGANLASGVYFYRLTAENYSIIKKMVLIK